ncbi:MAG TPA: lactate racemase domain-containing protein, partial [Lacipirellulaceae bacterium]|nr:lactate racemase domain-containing protein [Lacipirellulaceae bacterium]
MVKPLHPIEQIAQRLKAADGDGVRLSHLAAMKAAKNGDGAIEPASAVVEALASPLDFPPLAAGIVPGDRVAIAIERDVPCLTGVLRGAIESMRQAGIEPTDISVVLEDAETAELCRSVFGDETAPPLVVHSPADEKNLCLVGATKRGEPLLVNRTIFEADLVLPIGCARVGAKNVYDSLYPRFSDVAALEKYRSPAQREMIANRTVKRSEVDEAGWMIGVQMTVQVVPGVGDKVAHVLAGEPQAVAQRSETLCREQWLLQSQQRVGLVVATVTGGTLAQTWVNVGRA